MMREEALSNVMLSVIVPVYNVEKYLDRCLNSILNQTFQNFEVICVDDGSTDGSLEILRQYQKKDKRIKIIHKENGGLVSARKAGAIEAKGIYVACVDSDDWIESNMFEEMVAVAENTGADIVTSGVSKDYANHSVVETDNIEEGCYEGERLKTAVLERLVLCDTFWKCGLYASLVGKLFERELYKQCQMQVDDAISVGEDLACLFLCALNVRGITVTEGIYYHYCVRSNSINGVRKNRSAEQTMVFALKEHLLKINREYVNKIPNLSRQLEFFYDYLLLMRMPDTVIRYKDGCLLPFGKVDLQDRIVVYGSGAFGRGAKELLERCLGFNVVAWVDKVDREGVISPHELVDVGYDKLIIAVLKAEIVAQIKEELLERGVDENKIVAVDVKLLKNGDWL